MASLYSSSPRMDATITNGHCLYTLNDYTIASTSTATSTSLTEDLEGYIGQPMNQYNISRIRNTVKSHITTDVANGWIKYNIGTSGVMTMEYDQTTGTVTNDYNYNCTGAVDGIAIHSDYASGNVEIIFNGSIIEETKEAKKNREEREKKEEALYKRFEKQQEIKNNLHIRVNSRAKPIQKIPENEQVAIESLREVITETEFRKYLKYGFVLVKGKNGRTYQIFRNTSHTKVWSGGKLIEEICVKIADYNIPPTDNVIAVKTMLETSEEECYKLANVYKMEKAA